MPVQLIIDIFGIDDKDALLVDATQTSINAARLAVRQQLRRSDDTVLRIRLRTLALAKHFNYEGVNGFYKKNLIPRRLLAEQFKTSLPTWLSNERIVLLGLLKNAHTVSEQDVEIQFLHACHSDLLADNFYSFVTALEQQSATFLSILREDDSLRNVLCHHLYARLKLNKEIISLFIKQLFGNHSIHDALCQLAYQQNLQRLREVVKKFNLKLALPPQSLPSELLKGLPLMPCPSAKSGTLPELFSSALTSISQKIVAQQLPVATLASVLIIDWEVVLVELEDLTTSYSSLICVELVQKLQDMTSDKARQLAAQFSEYLSAACYPQLASTASVHEVLEWAKGYFDYLRPVLLKKQTPDERINGSFTSWLIEQRARIARSNADWRYCAKQIEQYLAHQYLVVVVMVDALSALNQDILLEQLANFDSLVCVKNMLFSPLPTITEVGKMAVLTGKPCHELPSDTEKALRETYKKYLPESGSLKIIKNWEDTIQHIDAQSNLVVFFENRLDECVHKSVDFPRYCEEIQPAIKQLKGCIKRWLKDAGGRDVVFFITADHGMTVTQGVLPNHFSDVKDRAVKIQANELLADDFVPLQIDTRDKYAALKTRHALTNKTVLAHGGLTPEEVLIPFITLTTRPPEIAKMPVSVELVDSCVRLNANYWQQLIRLTATEHIRQMKVDIESPFCLEKKCSVEELVVNKPIEIILRFSANYDQQGLTSINLQLNYDRDGCHEKNTHSLELDFPLSLLARDAGAQSFEDMF